MERRRFLSQSILGVMGLGSLTATGCRTRPFGKVMTTDQEDMVGSTAAGAATFGPLIETAVGNLLGRHANGVMTAGGVAGPMRICFVGVENKSAEEIGDFKEQIYEHIDTCIEKSNMYDPISRRFVEAALDATHLRADELFLPVNMRTFTAMLEQQGQPVDFLLFAKITSGTTRDGKHHSQRNYMLTLEMVNVNTGEHDKESAVLRKAYHS